MNRQADAKKLYGTFLRLVARADEKLLTSYEPPGVGTSMTERVTFMASILGAKDPYLAVLYPEHLDAILANKDLGLDSLTPVPVVNSDDYSATPDYS
jgi:hypothetical protein